MSEVKKCPKCGGEMEKGYPHRHNSPEAIEWFNAQRTIFKKSYRIWAYKCKQCHYIELYAAEHPGLAL